MKNSQDTNVTVNEIQVEQAEIKTEMAKRSSSSTTTAPVSIRNMRINFLGEPTPARPGRV